MHTHTHTFTHTHNIRTYVYFSALLSYTITVAKIVNIGRFRTFCSQKHFGSQRQCIVNENPKFQWHESKISFFIPVTSKSVPILKIFVSALNNPYLKWQQPNITVNTLMNSEIQLTTINHMTNRIHTDIIR